MYPLEVREVVTDTDRLWKALGAVSRYEIAFVHQLKLPQKWAASQTDDERDRVLAVARGMLRALRESGVSAATVSAVKSQKDADGRRDERWQLLHDLEIARAEVEPQMFTDDAYSPEDPLTIRHDPAPRYLEGLVSSHGWVTVHFDDRLSLAAVIAEIKRTWPKGLPSSRRPLGDRKLALVRFVCLESEPTDTWRTRAAAWNARYPDWKYADARAMQNAFQKAEKSLVGADGLRWYYDAQYRETWYETFIAKIGAMVAESARPHIAQVNQMVRDAVKPMVADIVRRASEDRERARRARASDEKGCTDV